MNDQHLTYPMYDSAIVTITVTDVNEYPNIVDGQSFQIEENSGDQSVVAEALMVEDEDEDEIFQWSFVSPPSDSPFTIEPSTGKIHTHTSTRFGSFKRKFDVQIEDPLDENLSGKRTYTWPVEKAPRFIG